MRNVKTILVICMALLISLLTFGTVLAGNNKAKTYDVTITNLTKKQVLTPPLVISHNNSYKLFTAGAEADTELVAIAEGGNTLPLEGVLAAHDDVFDFQTVGLPDGPILPGQSKTIEIRVKGRYSNLTVVGMLATTNDAFFAINGTSVPYFGTKTRTAIAYDAGSEANTELCEDVPGPPCAPDSGNNSVPDGAEGFVHVHNGIHGVGNLNAANMDWHNPVAKIEIRRVRH